MKSLLKTLGVIGSSVILGLSYGCQKDNDYKTKDIRNNSDYNFVEEEKKNKGCKFNNFNELLIGYNFMLLPFETQMSDIDNDGDEDLLIIGKDERRWSNKNNFL